MKKEAYLVMGAIALVILAIYIASGCKINWGGETTLTLEQNGVLIKTAASTAIVEVYNSEVAHGNAVKWADHVCSVSTIILRALDGDKAALETLHMLGTDPVIAAITTVNPPSQSTITIPTKTILLDLLRYTADRYGLPDVWNTRLAGAIVLFDTFIVSGVTTEHEVWFLTRAFFQGIVDGCASIKT